MRGSVSGSGFTLQLIGVPRLTSPTGEDVTPRLAKTQALLAFLALADETPVDRQTLQNLLWGDRMPQQGRDSLKKALTELRRAFADAPEHPLVTEGGPVMLRLREIAVDALSNTLPPAEGFYAPKFLDGLEFPNEGYMRWLEGIRAKLSARQKTQQAMGTSAVGPSMDGGLIRLGLMPLMCRESDIEGVHLGSTFADSLLAMLRQTGLFSVHDFRHGGPTPGVGEERGIDVSLSITATGFQDDVVLGMRLTTADTSEQLWSQEDVLHLPSLTVDSVNIATAGALDQICDCVHRRSDIFDENHLVVRTVIGAVDHMFRLSNADLGLAESALSDASEIIESSPLLAWHAFLSAFQVEKIGRSNAGDIIDRATYLSARALEVDRTNPLTRGLLAHVHSFVLRDVHKAHELIRPVKQHASRNVMLADIAAMLHYYQGDYRSAKTFAKTAVSLGRWHPFSYSFTTSLAMTQLMLGEYDQSIDSANRALAQHPVRDGHRYEPTLRTLATAQSLNGQFDDGRRTIHMLDKQSGTRTLDRMTDSDDAPFPNTDAFSLVRRGLEKLYV